LRIPATAQQRLFCQPLGCLRAHPAAVTIEVGGRHIPVRPREAEGAEREELWRLVNDNYNGYQVYQQRAGQRVIPVVLLEPA
jgi:F420H(2)-dependent quinone reductase